MGHQAFQDTREIEEIEGRMVCLENLASGVKLENRAWPANLERREQQVFLVLQDSLV